MAKKAKEEVEATEEDFNFEEPTEEEDIDATDISFDVEDEYKPTPLAPTGGYRGAVTEVSYNKKHASIDWTVTLNDNGGYMSDGETPIDGSSHVYKLWLPRPGDDVVMTKSGKQTKRQYKINSLKRFAKQTKLNVSSMDAIMEALENQEWLGLDVKVVLSVDSYKGLMFNRVEEMTV
jgi:hypothetical protein